MSSENHFLWSTGNILATFLNRKCPRTTFFYANPGTSPATFKPGHFPILFYPEELTENPVLNVSGPQKYSIFFYDNLEAFPVTLDSDT